jgi:hypothetical protein
MLLRTATIALAGLAASASAAVTVDAFEDGTLDISTRMNGSADLAATSALGGHRRVMWTIADNPLGSRLSIAAALDVADGLSVDMGPANASVVTISYGGLLASDELDFDAVGALLTDLVLDFRSADLPLDVSVRLATSDGAGGEAGSAEGSAVVPAGLNNVVGFNLAGLTTSGAYDAANIDSIEITFNNNGSALPDRDFFLRSVEFIPTPGTLSLLAVASLAGIRRRR